MSCTQIAQPAARSWTTRLVSIGPVPVKVPLGDDSSAFLLSDVAFMIGQDLHAAGHAHKVEAPGRGTAVLVQALNPARPGLLKVWK